MRILNERIELHSVGALYNFTVGNEFCIPQIGLFYEKRFHCAVKIIAVRTISFDVPEL